MVGCPVCHENPCMKNATDQATSVHTAMTEVLGAERDAVARLAACRRQADQQLEDARRAVRALNRNTQERIARLHAACAIKTRELIEQMESAAASADACRVPDALEATILRHAVSDVAGYLTSKVETDAD